MGELAQRTAALFGRVERPARYLDSEWGARRREDVSYRVCLVYPDTYELGMANQALAILYDLLNSIGGVAAERCFVPARDMAALLRAEGVPLATLESVTPLRECRMIGITLPYELTYTNVLETLDLAQVPLHSSEREEDDPLVLGGGPSAYNPEPLAPFLDAVLLGEGEEAAGEIVAAHRASLEAGEDRATLLRRLADVPGVYVPSLYEPDSAGRPRPLAGAPARVLKRVVTDLEAHRSPTCPVVPYMDVVHDRATVEVTRGCTRGCRFCQAGMVYRPVRERGADAVVRDALATLECTGYDEVSLTSLSTADHSQLEDVLRRLARRLEGTGISVSLPSLRVDAFSVDMARLVSAGRRSGLTFAPEAGTQRLRDVVNKNVTDDDLLGTVRRAFSSGWRRVKLYFMLGLPTETDDDIRGIGELVARVMADARAAVPPNERGAVRVGVSVSTFVPKAHTPFQWEPQLTLEEVRRRQAVLRETMPRKGVDLSWHDPEASFLEGVLARGDRRLAEAVEAAWRAGAVFDAWTEEFDLGRWLVAFESAGVDPGAIASGKREPGAPLPWEHLSSGVSTAYLRLERKRALAAEVTPDCSFGECTGCAVCEELGVDVVLGGERRGT